MQLHENPSVVPERPRMDRQASTTRLRPPQHSYDRRVVAWWRTQLLIGTAIGAVPLVILGLLIAPARVWLLTPALVILLGGLAAAIALPIWWYRVHRWEVTDRAVYTRTGYFWQNWRVAPMSRIQTVDTSRGPVQRAFGISTVTVTTASSAGAVAIAGLEQDEAERVAHELTLITDATPGDAT